MIFSEALLPVLKKHLDVEGKRAFINFTNKKSEDVGFDGTTFHEILEENKLFPPKQPWCFQLETELLIYTFSDLPAFLRNKKNIKPIMTFILIQIFFLESIIFYIKNRKRIQCSTKNATVQKLLTHRLLVSLLRYGILLVCMSRMTAAGRRPETEIA